MLTQTRSAPPCQLHREEHHVDAEETQPGESPGDQSTAVAQDDDAVADERAATDAPAQPVSTQGDQDPTTSSDAPAKAATSPEAVAAPVEVPRRDLKLVLTLQPKSDPGYHALLALGAEGCDPLFRSLDVDSLPAVLDEVPALVAEAQAHWQSQPRYPKATPPARPTTAPKRAGSAAKPSPPDDMSEPEAPPQGTTAEPAKAAESRPAGGARQPGDAQTREPSPDADPKPSSAGQLPLFG